MVRKVLIAAALAALAITTVAPTTADAGWRHRRGHGWIAPAIIGGALITGAIIAAESNRCHRRIWVETEYGPRRRWVNVCD